MTRQLEDDENFTGMYELLDAAEAVVKAADPTKREALAETIDAYATGEFFDEFFWARGPQSPALLHYLINAIDSACRPETQTKTRAAIRLVDRKPEGNA
jgi:hypothetical protein